MRGDGFTKLLLLYMLLWSFYHIYTKVVPSPTLIIDPSRNLAKLCRCTRSRYMGGEECYNIAMNLSVCASEKTYSVSRLRPILNHDDMGVELRTDR